MTVRKTMKLRFAILVIALAGVLLSATTIVVQAQWPAISSGYAVTTNWHGVDVPLGQPVTAWAGTTNDSVHSVEFEWKDPDETSVWNETVSVFGPFTTPDVPTNVPPDIVDWANSNHNVTIWYANCTRNPSVWTGTIIGDWGVKAKFMDTAGIPGHEEYTAFRATSFVVIPEVPFGIIAVLLSMFGAFFVKKKWTFRSAS